MGTESHILIHDIIDGHEERMNNLKKFYPFFRLCEHSLIQFRDGRYEDIDMGYVTMAVLRFFIEENSFNEQKVSYSGFHSLRRRPSRIRPRPQRWHRCRPLQGIR